MKKLALLPILLLTCACNHTQKVNYAEKCGLEVANILNATEYDYTCETFATQKGKKCDYNYTCVVNFYEYQPSDVYAQYLCYVKGETITCEQVFVKLL